MKIQRLLIVLTVINAALLVFLIARTEVAGAGEPAQILRGRGLEIVDDQGHVRASIKIYPADPKVEMPDGTKGYPESVLLRLISSAGRPNVKIAASERGAAVSFGGESDPTNVQILAQGESTSLHLKNKDGREQTIKP